MPKIILQTTIFFYMLQKGRVVMSVMLDYAPDDIALIQEQARASNTSVEEFIRQASLKAARNAAYLAKLDRSSEVVYSRRIDGENRLVYGVSGDTINIISCKGRYED